MIERKFVRSEKDFVLGMWRIVFYRPDGERVYWRRYLKHSLHVALGFVKPVKGLKS